MSVDTKLKKDEFYSKMNRLLNTPPGTVQGSQALSSLKNWDSLTILEFLVMADTDYRSDLQPSQVTACRTVDELATLTFFHSS